MARMMTPATCPTCGRVRLIRASDAGRARQCQRCHLTAIAPKGYAATKARYGERFAVQFMRDYRAAHPSNLEQIVMAWLDRAGIVYEREYWLQGASGNVYLIDFVIGSIAIEVNGTWAHSFHAERDARKVETLRAEGFTVIVLNERAIRGGTFAARLATAFQTKFYPTRRVAPLYTESIPAS